MVILRKTEVLQCALSSVSQQLCNTTISTQLKNFDSFKYLGSNISSDGSLNKDIAAHIQKASQALRRLCTKVLQHWGIHLSMKLKLRNAVVLPSLLCSCEMWTLYQKHIKQLKQFHTHSLQSIIQIYWQDRITNHEILNRAGFVSMKLR